MNRFDLLPHIAARYQFRRELYTGTDLWPRITLQRAILDALEAKPDQRWIFLVDGAAEERTLAHLGGSAHSFARQLLGSDRPTPDDVVAMVVPNSPAAVTSFFGAQLAGLTAFPTSMREGEESLGRLFERVGVAHVVLAEVDETRREWVERLQAGGAVKCLWLADARGEVRLSGADAEPGAEGPLPSTADGVHLVAYTSGSTSEPKIVLHTDAELLAESFSLAEVFGFFDTMLVAAPVGHITGILNLFTLPLVRRGDVVSLDRWNVDAALDACRTYGAETLAGTSLYFQQLLDRDPRMGGVRGGIAGGGPVAPVMVQRAQRASVRMVRSYGSTEHPTISQSIPDDPLEMRAGTDGRLNRGVEVRIVDERGNELPAGEPGEIVSRGPDAMAGYLEAGLDAAVYSGDGWFRTGDVGVLDARGTLTITDRIKDMIIRAGENISAKEVEDVLAEWDEVDEVVVVGVPDSMYGERACAFVVSRMPDLDLSAMRAYLESTPLEKFKWPEYLEVRDDLPRTPSGKVRKQALREKWEANPGHAAASSR